MWKIQQRSSSEDGELGRGQLLRVALPVCAALGTTPDPPPNPFAGFAAEVPQG